MNVSHYFLLYILYSMLGWIIEVTLYLYKKKRFINRGFLIGPYCPIYGKAALLVIILLKKYLNEPITLFILSIFICSTVEYIGSFILEKIFKTSWWDYRNKKFNINGRICLETTIPFGIGCVLLVYYINPFVINFLLSIPNNILSIIAIIIFVIYITDYIVSIVIIKKFKNISDNSKKDNTEKVTEYVKNQIIKKRRMLYIRLIDSFPNFKINKK